MAKWSDATYTYMQRYAEIFRDIAGQIPGMTPARRKLGQVLLFAELGSWHTWEGKRQEARPDPGRHKSMKGFLKRCPGHDPGGSAVNR